MIIDVTSDLHGHYPKLEGGDLLIVAGDLTARDTYEEHLYFVLWLKDQNYKKRIFISGNHDNLHEKVHLTQERGKIDYLCDSGTEFEGLRIWGSPWTKRFKGMNPNCMAFTVETEEELAEKWALIPDDVDILVTHCPPFGVMDEVRDYSLPVMDCIPPIYATKSVGSPSLRKVQTRICPYFHIFGHVHEGHGKLYLPRMPFVVARNKTIYINASHVNEHYKPVNKPIRIEL